VEWAPIIPVKKCSATTDHCLPGEESFKPCLPGVFLDILPPSRYGIEASRQGHPESAHAATAKLVLALGEATELCGTDGSVVWRDLV